MSYKDDLAVKIATSSSFDLVALQYEAIAENINELKKEIPNNNKEKITYISDKIRDIISNLIASMLDDNSEYRQKIVSLYMYINQVVTESIVKKDISNLDAISAICETQRDAWKTAGQNINKQNNANVNNAVTYGKSDINVYGSITDFGSV